VPQTDINVTDCAVLEKIVNPFCSFATPDSWTQTFHEKVAASNEMTMVMWIKILGEDVSPSLARMKSGGWTEQPRRVRLLSQVAPPKTLIEISIFRKSTQLYVIFPGFPDSSGREEVDPGIELETGRWIHFAISVGAREPVGKQYSMLGVVDATVMFDFLSSGGTDFRWEVPADGQKEFLQAIQFPGASILKRDPMLCFVGMSDRQRRSVRMLGCRAHECRRYPGVANFVLSCRADAEGAAAGLLRRGTLPHTGNCAH